MDTLSSDRTPSRPRRRPSPAALSDATPPSRSPAPLLDVAQVARRLGVSPRFVWQLVSLGRLTPVRLGRRCTRIDPSEVERLIDEARAR